MGIAREIVKLSLVYARLAATKAELDDGTFVEGHQLAAKLSKRVPKSMIGRRLSQDDAKKLLARFE